MAKQIGPVFVRNAIIKLKDLCKDVAFSGWRDVDQERVAELVEKFCNGEFGMAVMCNVQVMGLYVQLF